VKSQRSRPVWVVVKAERGIPVLAAVFQDRAQAERRERWLVARMREEYDAVGCFETKVAPAPR
jgi:hypothetical protein